MKAVLNENYGPPSGLKLEELPKPVPQNGEVLIKVKAVSINDWDLAYIMGKPRIYRLMSGLVKPKYKILGSDIAGIVETVGSDVSGLKTGDRVYGDLSEKWGGFAEYVCTTPDKLAIIPPDMSFREAAAIPQAGMLAVQGLLDVGKIQKGQKVLINGAGGGVGMIALQIVKNVYQCHVTGVDNASKADFMKNIGFDKVIDYKTEDFTKTGELYDLILDNKSCRSLVDLSRIIKTGGRYVTTGGYLTRILQVVTAGWLFSKILKKNFHLVALKPNKDLDYLGGLYTSGKLKLFLDQRHYSLGNTAMACEHFLSETHQGKIVVEISP